MHQPALTTSARDPRVPTERDAPGPPVKASTSAAAALQHVSKRYRHGGGVEDVTFDVARGEVLGFLGPNGAGKTTTIRLLLGLLRPDSGAIAILGRDARTAGPQQRRHVGYLPGDLALWDRLTGAEILSHLAHLRGGVDPTQVRELADRFDLDLTRPVRTLSRGNRQKVGIVQALMGDPELLVLDEPTSGLDPLVQAEVHRALRTAREGGCAVLLSSHTLSEVDQVADRVAVIRAGRMVAIEEVDDLRARALHRIEIRTESEMPEGLLAAVPGALRVELDGTIARLELAGPMSGLLRAIAPLDVIDMTVREPDLEEVFLDLYREHDDGT